MVSVATRASYPTNIPKEIPPTSQPRLVVCPMRMQLRGSDQAMPWNDQPPPKDLLYFSAEFSKTS
jgi:hypothetical protein